MILLCRASQFGKKISKLSFSESEYFLAMSVSGQNILNRTKTAPSATIKTMAIQVVIVILLVIPEYRM